MCLVFLAIGVGSKYKVVVASNRDEFLQRPSAMANLWSDPHCDVLAGRDLEPSRPANGTWFGMTKHGRFGVITNYREPLPSPPPQQRGRGLIIRDWLTAPPTVSLGQYAAQVHQERAEYGGFNVLLADLAPDTPDMLYVRNREHKDDLLPVSAGVVHGLSNQTLDDPWPKVQAGKTRLQRLLDQDLLEDDMVKGMLDILSDNTRYPDHELPKTGVAISWERALSSAFVTNPELDYGTRTQVGVKVDTALPWMLPGTLR